MKKILPVLLLFSFFCSDDATGPSNSDLSTIEDFPNNPGSWWSYAYYDSLNASADTVLVKVLEKGIQSDTTIWQYTFKTHTDTHLVLAKKDTVKIFSILGYSMPRTIFVFPMDSTSVWLNFLYRDSVISQQAIEVAAGNFEKAIVIKEEWGAFNDYGQITSWFVPGVGIVKKKHIGWSFGLANNTWELLEYNIIQ